jgi:hypothetical protein
MPSVSLSLFGVAALSSTLVHAQLCKTQSQPNPIAHASHPITGTVNGTIAVLPISYDLARSIVPAEFAILKDQIKAWLPWLPDDQYPVSHRWRCLCTGISSDVKLGYSAD